MTFQEILEFVQNPVVTAAVGFVCGNLVSRFTMTAKERSDVRMAVSKNSRELLEKQAETFQKLHAAIRTYNEAEQPTMNHFYEITSAGQNYFYQQMITADAILSGNVTETSRNQTLVPKIREAVERTLPHYYRVLHKISKKLGVDYNGELRRSDYESLYLVVEKFSHLTLPAANSPSTGG